MKTLRGNLVLAVCVGAMAIAFALPVAGASAAESSYCESRNLGDHVTCVGVQRLFFAVFGWGDQHSVCVGAATVNGLIGAGIRCSGGPGEGVYDPVAPESEPINFNPGIRNNAAGANVVHGIAYR